MRIGIDMDGVVADFTNKALENIKFWFNIDLKIEQIVETRMGDFIWPMLTKEIREGLGSVSNIYKKICPPEFFYNLDPFPGAINAIKKLHDKGHEIIFITKPLEWEHSSSEKIGWLKKYFKDIKYSVMMVSDMNSKYLIQTDVLIDDDPRALIKLAPYHGICVARPWNQEYRDKSYDGIVVSSMQEAAEWLIENEDFMSQLDRGGLDAPKSNKSQYDNSIS